MRISLHTNLDKEIANLSTVSDLDKGIMILYSQGFNYREIGELLNHSTNAIYYRLKKLNRNREVYDMLH